MILLVDIGNRRLKWSSVENVSEPAAAIGWRDACWGEVLEQAWAGLNPLDVLACNVAGKEVESTITTYCQQRWGLRPRWLRAEAMRCGLYNSYAQPETLGADRWAAMLGALELSRGPVLVVDCGTAVTVDLIDVDGRHLGGAIWPGIRTMRDSLRRSAANLDVEDGAEIAFANDTSSAIAGGSVQVLIGGLCRYRALARQKLGSDCELLLCGGDAELILTELGSQVRHEPNLVMYGLMRRFEVI